MLGHGQPAHYSRRVFRAWPRPGFLTATTCVALLLVAATGLIAETALNKEALADYRRAEAHAERIDAAARRGWILDESSGANRLRDTTGVRALVASRAFRVSLLDGELRGGEPDAGQARTFLDIVTSELSRYPEAVLDRAGLRYVLLCDSLTRDGDRIGSLPNLESTLVLDVSTSHDFLRRLIHHEVFHFLDFADDHQLGRDADWEALNDHFFTYGDGGRHERKPGSARLGSGSTGFLTAYSMAALEEDKAELFSFLMAQPAAVRDASETDPIVRAKVSALRAQVLRFDPHASWLPK